ncbi:MAG: tetratricopeptide repeat protein [Chitinispirillaceae bacterium]
MICKTALLLIAALFASAWSAECLDDSRWNGLGSDEKEKYLDRFEAESADDHCLCSFIRRFAEVYPENANKLTRMISPRVNSKGFSPDLLLCLLRADSLPENRRMWRSIVKLWIQEHQPVHGILMDYGEGGRMPYADSLYRALHLAGALDVHAYVRWGRVLSMLEKFEEAASVYCLICEREPRMVHLAFSQMRQFFSEAKPRKISPALDTFKNCISQSSFPDTALYRNWLAGMFGNAGLYEKEVETLLELDTPEESVAGDLLDIARDHFTARRYRFALKPAILAYRRLDKSSDAAVIAYQSYLELGVKDSALYWLRHADLSSSGRIADAATLCQETGHLYNARELIDSMTSSLTRDTLVIRQYLFAGEKEKAAAFAKDSLRHRGSRQRSLWRGRTLLFSSRIPDAAAVFDSLEFSPSWFAASEVLNYRFRIQKLQADYDALKVWSAMEYHIFTGNLQKGADLLRSQKLSGEAKEMISVLLGKAYLKKSKPAEAISALDLVNVEKHSPEFLYTRAEALYIVGRLEEARTAAEEILVDSPTDVHAQKARVLLAQIRSSQ